MSTFANRLIRVRDKMFSRVPPTNHIIEVDGYKNETEAEALEKFKLTNKVLSTNHIMFFHLVSREQIEARRRVGNG